MPFSFARAMSSSGVFISFAFASNSLFISIFESSLYEKGFREMDFNFSWGYMYGIFFAFVGALLVLLRATGKADTKKKKGLVAIQWLAYLWHLVCGLYYFWGFLQGAMYY